MTLALDNGVQRPVTGLQIGSISLEPVWRVAHLLGCCFMPRIQTPGRQLRKKRPSRTPCLGAIAMPKRKCPIISIIEVFYGIDTLKNGEPARFGSIIWEKLTQIWEKPHPSSQPRLACCFLFPLGCFLSSEH